MIQKRFVPLLMADNCVHAAQLIEALASFCRRLRSLGFVERVGHLEDRLFSA
jgi:hypothetical protein